MLYFCRKQITMTFRKIALAGAFLSFSTFAVYGQSCCKKPTGNTMKALALNAAFEAAHLAPLPINYSPKKGEMIQYPTAGGVDGMAFYLPSEKKTDKALIVVHEWWGLNDYIKREAENWQKALGGDVEVYAIDLYDGLVATKPEEAGKLMSGLQQKRAEDIVKGALNKIGSGKKIASIGWCMGGTWSFNTALLAGSSAAGCVMYYGFPEQDEKKIKQLKTDVLYIYGDKDNFIKSEDVADLGKKITANGHKFEQHNFSAVHAFANPSNPKYDAKSAGEAQVFALKFLKEKLSQK